MNDTDKLWILGECICIQKKKIIIKRVKTIQMISIKYMQMLNALQTETQSKQMNSPVNDHWLESSQRLYQTAQITVARFG